MAGASIPLVLTTARHADIAGPANGPPDNVNNVLDIASAVDKCKDVATAFYEPRVWLTNKDPNPASGVINVIEVGFAVDGVKNFPYSASFTIDPCN